MARNTHGININPFIYISSAYFALWLQFISVRSIKTKPAGDANVEKNNINQTEYV